MPVTYATSYPTAVPTVYYYDYPIRVRTLDDSSEGFETLRRRFGKVEITVEWTPVPDAQFYIVMQRKAPPIDFAALLTTNSSLVSEIEMSSPSQASLANVGAPLRRQSSQWYHTRAHMCTCAHTCMHVCMCGCVHARVHVRARARVRSPVCACVGLIAHMLDCTCVYSPGSCSYSGLSKQRWS